ncbi:MAG: class I SAM-dependent methyltransferase [Ignavibacteria bacterium]|nr:MAG: class I SAM-dependent methyltransferase [Ignavibacteria bacterium]
MSKINQIDYKEHWNKTYSKSKINKLGWYEESPKPSLDLIKKCDLKKDSVILDVGSGTTTLIEKLLEDGYSNIVATDISDVALTQARENLKAEETKLVKWIVDDITNPKNLTEIGTVDLWHDRTVLHFLTEENQREGYLSTLKRLVKVEGYVIIAVFSLEGAKKCSGLDIVNYDHMMISKFLGDEFKLLEHFPYLYIQPSGGERPYVYTLFKRNPK